MNKEELINCFKNVRQQTESLCSPLATEDYVIQSSEDISPPKWHLAHVTWFFETFILAQCFADYQNIDPSFRYLFNSYYQGINNPYPRANRGLLSRPTVATILNYRRQVDNHIMTLIEKSTSTQLDKIMPLITLGLHHEQQHQELLLMDIKHNFSIDPNFPCYKKSINKPKSQDQQDTHEAKIVFIEIQGGLVEIGHRDKSFCFDNELPVHKFFLMPYLIASRLVTNGEYLDFITDGGYKNPHWWLSAGWDCIDRYHWQAPLYWYNRANEWSIFTLNGLQQLDKSEPVSHLSYYEAEAYARWFGARLPTEEEWEYFVSHNKLLPDNANLIETGYFHPQAALREEASQPQQFFGELWEWTASPYTAYSGYKPLSGTLGEYNGKFMANQIVLRGGSCTTPRSHIRASYRNFFQPEKRWQFSGIRLAQS